MSSYYYWQNKFQDYQLSYKFISPELVFYTAPNNSNINTNNNNNNNVIPIASGTIRKVDTAISNSPNTKNTNNYNSSTKAPTTVNDSLILDPKRKAELLRQIAEQIHLIQSLADEMEYNSHWLTNGLVNIQGKKTTTETFNEYAKTLNNLWQDLHDGKVTIPDARKQFLEVIKQGGFQVSESVEAETGIADKIAYSFDLVESLSEQAVQLLLSRYSSELGFLGSAAYRLTNSFAKKVVEIAKEEKKSVNDKEVLEKAFQEVITGPDAKQDFQQSTQMYLTQKLGKVIPPQLGKVISSGALYLGSDLISQILGNMIAGKAPLEEIDPRSLLISFVCGVVGGTLSVQLDKSQMTEFPKLLTEAGYDSLAAVVQSIILSWNSGEEIKIGDLFKEAALEFGGELGGARADGANHQLDNTQRKDAPQHTEGQVWNSKTKEVAKNARSFQHENPDLLNNPKGLTVDIKAEEVKESESTEANNIVPTKVNGQALTKRAAEKRAKEVSLEGTKTRREQVTKKLNGLDTNKPKGLETREELVQNLNDLSVRQNRLEAAKQNTEQTSTKNNQEIAKFEKAIEEQLGGKIQISENVKPEQRLNILKDLESKLPELKQQGVTRIVIAHGKGSLADGNWRMNGIPTANLDTIGAKFAENSNRKVLVIACTDHEVNVGRIYENGKTGSTEFKLANGEKLIGAVRLGGEGSQSQEEVNQISPPLEQRLEDNNSTSPVSPQGQKKVVNNFDLKTVFSWLKSNPVVAYAPWERQLYEKDQKIKESQEIQRIQNGVVEKVRASNELSEADVVKLIDSQIKEFSIQEIRDLINSFPPKDRKAAELILLDLVQFSNMENLIKLHDEIAGLGTMHDNKDTGDLLSTFKYLEGKEIFNIYRIPDRPYYSQDNSGGNMLLDQALLQRLKDDPEFRNEVIDKERTLLYPEGWMNGINPFNQANFDSLKTSIQNTLEYSNKIRKEDKSISLEASISLAINSELQEALEKIDPRLRKNLWILKNWNINPNETILENIQERLSTTKLTEENLKQLLNELNLPDEYKQIALEIFAHGADIYSFRRMGEVLKDTYLNIIKIATEKSIKEEDIYYVIPHIGSRHKSFQLVNFMFSLTNNISANHIIDLDEVKNLGDSENKMIVILDDVSGTGASLANAVSQVRDWYEGNQGFTGEIIVAPIVSTELAFKSFTIKNPEESRFTNIVPDTKFTYLPTILSQSFTETDYYKSLSEEIQSKFNNLMGYQGVGGNGANINFPYMSPDNNNVFWQTHIAPLLLPSEEAVKWRNKEEDKWKFST